MFIPTVKGKLFSAHLIEACTHTGLASASNGGKVGC